MAELTPGQTTALRPRIERKRKTNPTTGCIVWTGGTAANPPYPVLNTTLNKKRLVVSVRPFIWSDQYENVPEGHRIWMTCDTPLCTNVKHMELLTSYEVMEDGKIKTFDPNEYKYVNCDRCGHICRQRGKYQIGVYKAYPLEDGSIICGRCQNSASRKAAGLDNSALVQYSGSIDGLVEDAEWLLDFGESPIAAAARLKFDSVDDFYTVLTQVERPDLVTRFRRIGVVNDV